MSPDKALELANSFVSRAKLRGKFDFNAFKELDDPKRMKRFLADPDYGLQLLGYGSSREAYLLSSKYVIKFAVNEAGAAQNKMEHKLSNDSRFSGLAAKVYEYHPKFTWITSELVRPLTGEDEFKNLTGINYQDFRQYIRYGTIPESGVVPLVAKRISNIINEKLIATGDALKIDSWGKAPDGRLVLFDYGLTSALFKEYYDPTGTVKEPGFDEPETVRPGAVK